MKPWPKTPRWVRQITVTEKIDGTNAAMKEERMRCPNCYGINPQHCSVCHGSGTA